MLNRKKLDEPVSKLSLEELADAQGVAAAEDLEELAALWPEGHDPDLLLGYILDERSSRRGRIRRQLDAGGSASHG